MAKPPATPPWSAIVAYDLNTGTIKWRVPLGEDARAAAEGAKNAGVFMAERHGMVVTSTGLLFIATTDGKVRAGDLNKYKAVIISFEHEPPTDLTDRLAEFQSADRSIVLVCHSMSAVKEFCDQAVWLDGGKVRQIGPSREVVEQYLAGVADRSGERARAACCPRWGRRGRGCATWD